MSLLALTLFLSAEIKCRPIAGTPKACLNLPQTPLCAGRSLSHNCRPRLIPGMRQFSLTSGLLYSKSPLLEPGSSDSDTVSLTHPDLGSYDPLQRSLTFSPQGPCLVTVLNKESCACPARLLSDSWVLVSVACQLPSTLILWKQDFSQTCSSLISLGEFTNELHASSCLCLPSTRVTGIHCHAWIFTKVLGI